MFSKTEEVWLRAYCSALEGCRAEGANWHRASQEAQASADAAVKDFAKKFGYEKGKMGE